ncbi:MAG: hypothetical protein QOG25_1534 [Acetobacteraceae bacterium]|nr:hypothetical protein [Acetobacteraceae bacterium]
MMFPASQPAASRPEHLNRFLGQALFPWAKQ